MMDPKVARALRAARMRYNQGGMVNDPRAFIDQSLNQIMARPRRSANYNSAPVTQESFGVPSWVSTEEILRRQREAAAAAAAANPQPAAPQQSPRFNFTGTQFEPLANALRNAVQNPANPARWNETKQMFGMFRGLGDILMGRG